MQNASRPPLLQLPLEIRDKIWRLALGDRLIHLDCAVPRRGQIFQHIVCEDDCPEDVLVKGYSSTKENGDVVTVWRRSHRPCGQYLSERSRDSFKHWNYQSIHLKVLRVCRQVYIEANNVLWMTNTFSFNGRAVCFNRFMKERTTPQKRLLRRLRLQMDWTLNDDKLWKRALNTAVIKSLPGLRKLRLQINHSVKAGFYQRVENGEKNLALFEPRHLAFMRRVAMFALVDVEVYVGARTQLSTSADRMARARKEYAEAIRKVLLDPNGARICSDAMNQGRIQSKGLKGGTPGL